MIKLNGFIFLFLSYIIFNMAFADSIESQEEQELKNDSKSVKLQELVATGAALQTDVAKIPGNVSIINENQLSKMPNTKITDSIKKLAGVRIDNDVSYNPRPRIRIRGINYGTLILLDGVILSDLEGESRILNQISLYDVERVEVARGAFSSLYGAGAIGGVVNFITSMPTKFEAQAIIGYGSEFEKNTADRNLVRLFGSIGGALLDKKLRLKLSAGFTRTDGYSSFPTIYPNSDNGLNNLSGYYTDKAGNRIIGTGGDRDLITYDVRLKSEYDINESSMIGATFSISNNTYEFKNPISFLRDNNGNPTNLVNGKDYFVGSGYGGIGSYTHILGSINYQYEFLDSVLKISLSSVNLLSWWQDANQDSPNLSRYGGAGKTQDTDSSSNYLDIIYSTPIFEKHNLTAALQFRYYWYVQKNRNMTNWLDKNSRTDIFRQFGQESVVASSFISVDSEWLPSLSTSFGLRYDYWQNFNGYMQNNDNPAQNRSNQHNFSSIFSPKFGLTYKAFSNNNQDLIFKTSVGSGFRMPTLRDSYQFTHGTSFWDTNQDLNREIALSFEVGAEYNYKRFYTSIYYYQTELWGMIYRQGNGTQANPWKFVNAGRGRINGIELSANIPLFFENLYLESNYTLTLATILKNPTNPSTEGNQLANTPKHIFNISLNYLPNSGFFASIWAHFIPAFYNSDTNSMPLSNTYGYYENQFSLNAKFGYIFKFGLELSTTFLNMTNYRYYDFYRVAGASYFLQIKYKL